VKKPSLLHAFAEPVRASGEYATSLGLFPFLRLLPSGDGHPVLTLPGFMATDRSTRPLRRLLTALGYPTSGWGLGRNVGPTQRAIETMPLLLERMVDEAGAKASIVGWSLGGIYARHLATLTPELVRSVVTMGTPVRREVREASNAQALFDSLKAIHLPGLPILDDGEPLEVPVTAMYTRSDGIVHWETCIVQDAPNAENLRVRGSHVGLGFNPAVAYIVADRLAQPEGAWRPFTAPAAYRSIITADHAV
jgi:pimeloyl-ACP methyl ester carboxylesterase